MSQKLTAALVLALLLIARPVSAEEIDFRETYEAKVRHRLPAKLTTVVDGALTLYDMRGLVRALPEMWRLLRDDPDLQALAANLAQQYIPRLDYAGYVGTLADSTRYAGAAFGIEADLAAPICRYIGGAFNGQAYNDRSGSGLAWDTRVTGCLPWGPFALELGFISKREVRMGLAAAPTSGAGRFDSQGFEMRIRGFRWLHTGWELVTLPTDVVYTDVDPDIGDGRESVNFSIQAAAVRFIRYGAGADGQDRVVEGIPVRVQGTQDAVGKKISATVVGFGAVAWEGARFSPMFYLDGNLMFQQGSINSTVMGAEPRPGVFTGAVDLGFHALLGGVHSIARYHRGLLPDDEFRILVEDRGEMSASFQTNDATWEADLFAAYTRTVLSPEGVAARPKAGTYGAKLLYGRVLTGPLYLTLRGEAARSYYANAGEDALSRPEVELRAIAGVAVSWTSPSQL